MALSQAQWYDKIRAFVPSWYFEQEKYSVAQFQAIAALLAAINQDADDQFDQTFILEAQAPVIDALGDERGIDRQPGEITGLYAKRVQRITSATDKPDIKSAVDSLLLTGTCDILESPKDNPFCSRDSFCSRGVRISEQKSNYFLIVAPRQIHAPYSFCSRGYFASRSYFIGSLDSTDIVFTSIIAFVDKLKAFGVMYGIVEV